MSLNQYIDKQIIDKNRNIYFKHYRWIVHALWMFFFTLIGITESISSGKDISIANIALALLPLIPFYVFFYYYCLYLLPYCFKLKHHRKFWLHLLTLLLVFPVIYYCIEWNIKGYFPDLQKDLDNSHFSNLASAYVSFLSSFVSFTAMLYFFELLEEIRTVKETAEHKQEYSLAALNKIKTEINPVFMSASLDGIIHLAEAKDSRAAEAVIHFADVLRYRLYKSKSRLVLVAQEIAQLQNLFRLQQSLPDQRNDFSLDIEGVVPDAQLVPLSLITSVEPLFNLKEVSGNISLLMYLLIEEREIQVAIELNTSPSPFLDLQFGKIRKDLAQLNGEGINFTLEKEQNNYSLRTCIPIFKNSIA